MATRIIYLIRVSGSAFMESSPREITEFISQGIMPEVRIVADIQESTV